jgi:hypothetical protein
MQLLFMKDLLRTAFSPILSTFESGDEEYNYRKSHRTILIVMGVLFGGLASIVFAMASGGESMGFLIPVVVFGLVSLVTLVVGLLGNERAVSKIWGNK